MGDNCLRRLYVRIARLFRIREASTKRILYNRISGYRCNVHQLQHETRACQEFFLAPPQLVHLYSSILTQRLLNYVQRAICRTLHHLCFSKENSFYATADFIDFIEFIIIRESGRREKEREVDRQNREREKSIKHKIRTISLIHLAPVDLNHALPHIYFRYLQIYRYIYVHIL